MIHLTCPASQNLLATGSLLPSFALMFPVVCLVIAGMMVVVILNFQNKERERWHATVRLAMEKGVTIPGMTNPTVQDAQTAREKQRIGFVVAGLVNMAIGVGVFMGLSGMEGASQTRYFGLIPGLIGVALLLSGLMFFRKRSDVGDQAPRS